MPTLAELFGTIELSDEQKKSFEPIIATVDGLIKAEGDSVRSVEQTAHQKTKDALELSEGTVSDLQSGKGEGGTPDPTTVLGTRAAQVKATQDERNAKEANERTVADAVANTRLLVEAENAAQAAGVPKHMLEQAGTDVSNLKMVTAMHIEYGGGKKPDGSTTIVPGGGGGGTPPDNSIGRVNALVDKMPGIPG